MEQHDNYDVDYLSGSETQSLDETAPEEGELKHDDHYNFKIESEKYSSGKPRRVVIRAKIIHD